ncbi:glycosyltransferase family 4 protein [Paraburkholderia flava]|uniref:glycosyltransferase family 4 protein n=1 Tax=Paraburkholderia flava TaxID=2547393 RepID=UPI00105BF22D|nr:glycosyltransferase family 4 protein [Paraburkholderia flava]
MKVAIVHDWLVAPGGAEKVLEQIVQCFPDADLFSLVDFLEDRAPVRGKSVTTSFIQRLPFARKRYRAYLPLMPLAVEQFDLSGYDLIVTSSYAVAKGVLVGPDQIHVSYVHSPMRYAWDLQHQYLREAHLTRGPRSWATRVLLHYLRGWDARSANGVDCLIANSHFVARRMLKTYRREASVIAPPVDVQSFDVCEQKDDFYLTASRMVPYKRMDLIVEAFTALPQRRLVVIGDGPEMQKIREKAGPNVEILGYQSFAVLKDHMQRAKAFVFAAEEDFGIAVVEAQACGTPVIAYGKGGALETVVPLGEPQPTGVHFGQQSVSSLLEAVDRFERHRDAILPAVCRANAERFSAATFRRAFMVEVTRAVAAAGARGRRPVQALDPAWPRDSAQSSMWGR